MKICHAITRLIVGGAQENTLLTCEGLHARGHAVLLIAGPDGGPEGTLWPRARTGGYAVVELPDLHRAIAPLADRRALRALRECYRGFAPDVIHTHSSKAGILGRWAARAAPAAAVVHTIHGMSFNQTQPRWLRALYRQCERSVAGRTDRFVTVADAMTRQAVAAGLGPPERFVTVYSGMDTTWFAPDPDARAATRARLGIPDDAVVVGTVARLFRNKGYEQIIAAAARAAAACPTLRFMWIGDGPDRADYAGRMAALGLGERLHLTGLVPPRAVGEWMQAFDLLVHASQWEGLPRAVVQALLMEIPVVSYDNDGAPEVVIDGETGRLIRFNDLGGLSAAIVELAGDGDLRARLGRAGRKKCAPLFTAERMVGELEKVYAALCRG